MKVKRQEKMVQISIFKRFDTVSEDANTKYFTSYQRLGYSRSISKNTRSNIHVLNNSKKK